jgi:NAD(P)-dependent dehydrogenase (short-subunit alcohol dehydrogenase family)
LGCAKAFRALGADLAVTYLNERAKKHVEPLAMALEAPIFMPLDVNAEGQTEQVFARIEKEWGRQFSPSLDRLLPEGSAARSRGRRRAGRLPQDDGCLLLVVHADGASGGAADRTAARSSP